MLHTTSFTSSLSHEIITTNLHYSRKLLLHTSLSQSPNDQMTNKNHHKSFDSNIIMVLSLLLFAIVCSLFISTLIKCGFRCLGLLNMVNQQKLSSSGVDKRALKTFQVIKYSKEENIKGLDVECVICLSEFKEGEKIRVLPKCHHGFHVKCIDKWLSLHTSCPTCRQSLVNTCHKIIGCDHRQAAAAAATTTTTLLSNSVVEVITGEIIAIIILPLERENMVRNNYSENVS